MPSSTLGDVSVFTSVELPLTFLRLLVLRLGLNSHSHMQEGLSSLAQFAFRRLSVIRSTRRFFRLRLSVVVFVFRTLVLNAFMVVGV